MATLKKTQNTVTTQPSRRRISLGPSTPLRSPVVKRHPSAPVTIQGWLHKQGSEGLMLWKKRWFVLSEYVLFYYKGYEEEKLLGSILLPSYKISPCSSDDKVFRKFSFKAEHANMRTYYFAADTRESMIQWMNALSLASILQLSNNSWDDKRLNNEDNDSGFHGTYGRSRSKQQNNDWSTGVAQPLYANAPPKPRRLNETSPDRSPEHGIIEINDRSPRNAQPQEYSSTPTNSRIDQSPYQYVPQRPFMLQNNAERRTPDTYGRSNTNTPAQNSNTIPTTGKVISSKPKNSEYEELYNIHYRSRLQEINSPNMPMGQVPSKQNMQRPYSADFLEYEHNNSKLLPLNKNNTNNIPNGTVQNRLYFNPPPPKSYAKQPRRPKSSMEFIDPSTSNDFWSEENYAQKMRQSAIYVSPPASQRAITPSSKQHVLDRRPDDLPYSESSLSNETPKTTNEMIANEMKFTSNLIREQERKWNSYFNDNGRNYFQRSASARLPRTITPDEEDDEDMELSLVNSQGSSREGTGERKSQQREESMKRLLEWKQRMLQSPLTRKSSGSSTRGTSNDLSKYYGAKQQQMLRDGHKSKDKENIYEDRKTIEERISNLASERLNISTDRLNRDRTNGITSDRHGITPERLSATTSRIQDGRRSVNSNSRYNSYSSDDEELNGSRDSRKRSRRQTNLSIQSKSSDRSSSKTLQNIPNSFDYETMCREQTIKPSLSPESKYLNSYNYTPAYEPMEKRDSRFSSNVSTLDKKSHGKSVGIDNNSKYGYKYTIDFNEDKRADLDDRFSKHSDSGYDTLRAPTKILPPNPDVSDLLKFRFDDHQSNFSHAYPVQTTDSPRSHSSSNGYDKNGDNWGYKGDDSKDLYQIMGPYDRDSGNKSEAPPKLVQNRIKEFEVSPDKSETKAKLKMQEPLKLSSTYRSNEAHVSPIKSNENSPEHVSSRQKTELNGFSKSEPSTIDEEAKYAVKRDIKNQNPKSVKDLLADFEKKSQLLKEQSEAEAKIIEEASNRYVFSDTETLLYDTSSDHEPIDNSILNHVRKCDAPLSEDDEEVAAALGKQNSYFSACRDIGRKSDKANRKNSKTSLGDSSNATDVTLGGYNRLSIADSMVTHDDLESHKSFPCEKELNTLEEDATSNEEHYMPMTPSKKNVLSPTAELFASHSRSNSAIMEDLLTNYEESSYVEMTENGLSKSLFAPKCTSSKNNLKRNNSAVSSNYCEIDNKNESHYDLLYKSGSSQHYEPLYMEVNSKKPNEEPQKENVKLTNNHSRQNSKTSEHLDLGELPPTPPRIILPDILNSSTASIQKQTSSKSDSSDADDEASKDLDSIDTPRHPRSRFSLSDTFRPASYYLGASVERTVMEQQDSSDSDLVSPPPIPKSPPPIEDLDTSLDSTNLDNSKLDLSRESLNKRFEKEPHQQLWNPPSSSHKSDLKTVHEKMEMHLDDTMSSETDSINSMRKDRHELLMKRRPVSADILNSLRTQEFTSTYSSSGRKSVGSDLDSIGSRNGLAVTDNESIDFDQYLEDLQVNHNLDFSNLSSKNYDYDKNSLSNGYMEERYDVKLRYNTESQQSFYSQGSSQNGAYGSKDSSTGPSNMERVPPMNEVHYENLNPMYGAPPPPLPPTATSLVPPPRPPSYNNTLERRKAIAHPQALSMQIDEPYDENENFEQYERLRTDASVGEQLGCYNPLPISHRRQDSTVGILLNSGRDEVIQNHPPKPPVPQPFAEGVTATSHDQSNSNQRNDSTGRETMNQNNVSSNQRNEMSNQAQEGEYREDSLGAPYYYSDLLKEQEDSLVSDNSASSYPNASKNYTNPIPRSLKNNKLNNQRDNKSDLLAAAKRNDIGRKVNHLVNDMNDMDEATRFAVELKATSEQFMGAEISTVANKCAEFDEKNLYESDTIQRRKSSLMTNNLNKKQYRSQTPDPLSTRNFYPLGISDKNESYGENELSRNRRSRSLEGLLDDSELYADPNERPNRMSPGSAISRLLQTTQPPQQRPASRLHNVALSSNLPQSSRVPPPPPDVWEEDTLWRESLRRVSLRHTRSLDDLDQRDVSTKSGRQSADILSNQKKISREVTYVNDIVTSRLKRSDTALDNDDGAMYVRLSESKMPYPMYHPQQTKDTTPSKEQSKQGSFLEQGMYPTRPPSFEIDREKLRQWDLMSSAPSGMLGPKGQPLQYPKKGRSHVDNNHPNNTPPSSPASGSGSMIGRDPLPPRVRRHSVSNFHGATTPQQVSPTTITNSNNGEGQRVSQGNKRGTTTWGDLSVSAGELLGRTHEELVLLLIQLRRQSAGVCKSMESCHREIETQARLSELETPKRLEHIQKLEELKRHLLELEKQYEKGKPLVNLVDNMVKLGSLYRAGTPLQGSGMNLAQSTPHLRERLEFNHKVQEQRLLAEERKDWDRLSPNHNQLQAKVEQLYRLDRILQEESGTLQSLQQDKEMLESALGSLRHKMHGIHASPAEVERYRRQQRLLERELSRVRSILAHNSKKLEETVAANARLESELVVLRQKLQWSRREVSNGNSGVISGGPTVAALETELRRVQTLVGDLQRQRQELSAQVKQLTEKSNSLSQQIRPGPTGVAGAGPVGAKRRSSNGWLETDLDLNSTQDIGIDSPTSFPSSPQNMMSPSHEIHSHSPMPLHGNPIITSSSPTSVPLYVNTDASNDVHMNGDAIPGLYDGGSSSMDEGGDGRMTSPQQQYCKPMDISEADDRMKRFYGIIPKDKPQEIKTVRIVKRESERRQRDRDRSGNIGIPVSNSTTARRVTVIEESTAEHTNEPQPNDSHRLPGDSKSQETENSELPSSKCSSLPRGFGRHVNPPPPPPAPRSDSIAALRNIMARSNKYKTDHDSNQPPRLSAREQLFGSSSEVSPATQSSDSSSTQVSPVFKSEAAKQIIQEVSNKENNSPLKNGQLNKRAIPKEKRRHHTVTSSSTNPFRYDRVNGISRARDDLDMEVALRPRLNGAPDVVRSTLSRTDPVKYSAETIDSILGTPGKIVIPERYIPETTPTLSKEEKNKRFQKAEAIRKMLSESNLATCADEETEFEFEKPILKKKMMEEKKQREHLLQLNQILAQQVMERSKQVAGVNNSS